MQPLEHLRAIAERVAASRGLMVWEIQSRREASGHVVRVFIDRPGPAATPEESVSIEDCEQVNREISTILDVEDPLPFAYTLEVSSPGLDRPLRTRAHFERAVGRNVRLKTDKQKARGEVVAAGERSVQIRTGPAAADIPYDEIVRANLIDEGN